MADVQKHLVCVRQAECCERRQAHLLDVTRQRQLQLPAGCVPHLHPDEWKTFSGSKDSQKQHYASGSIAAALQGNTDCVCHP